MKNREVFQRDPTVARLLNDGVATVREAASDKEIETLRYELEHFVCEGQYEDGFIRILESYIGSINATTQPAAWVSGFFGSGKSHLLKMFRHLWQDTRFADGATARGLANLPQAVTDLLRELDTLGKRCGGLHAASGTLQSGGHESVRLAVLKILFASRGLPPALPQARFCMWLQKNAMADQVAAAVKATGKDFLGELNDLYVSPLLAQAVLRADPDFAADTKQAREALRLQFPNSEDVSTDDFIRLAKEVLAVNGQMPCTVLVLDEIQLYIGNDPGRSLAVQEVAEALCKQLDSRLLLIGAGQTALAGNDPLLQRLAGRFTIAVELSDADVETVTRRVVLAKKADKKKSVEDILALHRGEIDRQLAGTRIATRVEDRQIMADDYPLLPVRRRFWEHVLRAIDAPGTASQLRTQLKIVHEAVRDISEKDIGTVVGADFIFDQLQPDLLRSGVLLREIDETIRKFDVDNDEDRLARRLCGLIFLIRKLPRESVADIGVRATPSMLADMLVSDLSGGGTTLRREIPRILDKLVEAGTLIKLEDEYSLQTRESSEWDREFRNRQTRLASDMILLASRRSALIGATCAEMLKAVKLNHGQSKEPRKILLHFGSDAPVIKSGDIPLWVRDGWGERESVVINDARAAGSGGAMVYAYIPKGSADDLQKALVDYDAATATLEFKGAPATPEGREARSAMATRQSAAEATRDRIVKELVDRAKVWQSGGSERYETNFVTKVDAAARAALDRLFPRFREADDHRWSTVITRARNGDAAALTAVEWNDAPEKHPVLAAVSSEIGSGRAGRDLRETFEQSPYGWPRDVVDAALIMLHTMGHIRATHKGQILSRGELDQGKISITDFRVEAVTLNAGEKIKLRTLFHGAGVDCRPNEEATRASDFLNRLVQWAAAAGGDPPLPVRPATTHVDTLRSLSGTEQLAEILKQHDVLARQAAEWHKAADLAAKRMPAWIMLGKLLGHCSVLADPAATELRRQANAVETQRRLLDAGDPVPDIRKAAGEFLRGAITAAHHQYCESYQQQMAALAASAHWRALPQERRQELLAAEGIGSLPELAVGHEGDMLSTLEATPLAVWKTKIDALPQQFARAALAAARMAEPKMQTVRLASGTLKTPQEVQEWIKQTEKSLLERIKDGPVVIS